MNCEICSKCGAPKAIRKSGVKRVVKTNSLISDPPPKRRRLARRSRQRLVVPDKSVDTVTIQASPFTKPTWRAYRPKVTVKPSDVTKAEVTAEASNTLKKLIIQKPQKRIRALIPTRSRALFPRRALARDNRPVFQFEPRSLPPLPSLEEPDPKT